MSKLKELREQNNISKVDMCKMLCMSENSYSKKECNVGDMKFKDIMKICSFLIAILKIYMTMIKIINLAN